MPLCANRCGRDFSEFNGWWIEHTDGCPGAPHCDDPDPTHDHAYRDGLCSIDCLLAFAWRIKESQPKLSKSKERPNA